MARAYLKLSNRDDLYLQDTRVENLFISEFMPGAPEGYVKVYLFGLMYAQNNRSLDTTRLARALGIDEETIIKAWGYWGERGLVDVQYNEDFTEYSVEYLSQVDAMYGKRVKATPPATTEEDIVSKVVDTEIKAIYRKYEELTGKMISSEDAWKIGDAIKTYDILPDVMSYAVDCCVGEDHPSINYIIKTAVNWAKEGCRNLADVKEYLDAHSKRKQYYNLVFHEMGWNRLPSPGDREIMDRWFDELGCSIKEVLDACKASSGIREPSLKYVNKVIENRKLEAGGINTKAATGTENSEAPKAMVSRKVLREYYDFIRAEGERELDARIDEACNRIVELRGIYELENKLNAEMLSTERIFDSREQKQRLRDQKKELEDDKRRYLLENGYSADFLTRKFRCKICKDTGITDDGRICTCSEARAQEAYRWNQERNH